MRKAVSLFAVVLWVLGAAALVAPGVASAQTRQFIGKIDKVSEKELIVDNRKGDKVPFVKMDDTVVEGEGKTTWEQLKKEDWVSVDWKMVDKPRKAYKVQVMPPREEAGEDAE